MSVGCNDITSPLLNFDSSGGCPSTCKAKHKMQLASIRCADVPAGDSKLKALAARYIQWFNMTEGTPHSGRRQPLRVDLAVLLSKSGCVALESPRLKAFPGVWTNNLLNCELLTPDVKTLFTMCPVTCGCALKKTVVE